MENQNEFQMAVKVTILGMIVYLVSFTFFGIKIEPERVIGLNRLIGVGKGIPLSFEVSHWWNLLIFPLIILFLRYAYGTQEIIGREPNSSSIGLHYKHLAKQTSFTLTRIALVFFVWTVIIVVAIGIFAFKTNTLLEGVLGGIIWAVCVYTVLGFLVSVLLSVEPSDTSISDESSPIERYLILSKNFIKIGLLKTFPMLIGITLGFIIQSTLVPIWRFFKKLTVGFKKSPVS